MGDRIREKLDSVVDEAASYFEEHYDITTDSGVSAFEDYLSNPSEVLSDISMINDANGGPVSGLNADDYLESDSSSMPPGPMSPPISDMPSKLGPKPPMGGPPRMGGGPPRMGGGPPLGGRMV